jgi:hypothetical protein
LGYYYVHKKENVYTTNENLGIIDKLKCSGLKASLLQEFGVPDGTIHGLMKEEDKLKIFVDQVEIKSALIRKSQM